MTPYKHGRLGGFGVGVLFRIDAPDEAVIFAMLWIVEDTKGGGRFCVSGALVYMVVPEEAVMVTPGHVEVVSNVAPGACR